MRYGPAVIAWLFLALPGYAALELPPLISDRMVLQAGTQVPIWGKAEPKEKIKVSFRGKALSVVADASGDWKIVLPKMERDTLESKGSELVISAGARRVLCWANLFNSEGFPALGFETEIK